MKTLSDHLSEYLDHLRSLNYSPRTLKKKRLRLRSFVGWLDTTYYVLTPDRLREKHLQAWQQHLLAWRTIKGYPLKPASINSFIGITRSFLEYLVGHGYIIGSLPNALERVKEPKLLPSGVLTHSQVKKVLRAVDTSSPRGYRDRTILELLYSSGLRADELLALDLVSINFEDGTAQVLGKGSKERVVPVGRTALKFLKGYVIAVRPFLVHDRREQALFLHHDGKRYPYHTLRQMIHACTKKAKLDTRVTPHTFRRSCTTEMIRSGANIYHVKELLGHETLNTLRHYTRLTIIDLKKTHRKCHPREQGNG